MIAFLEGILIDKVSDTIIVNVNGVGYRVEIPLTTYYDLGELGSKVSLFIVTLVREDAIRLFGFRNVREKRLFELFLTISRIGPKLALNILSGMEVGPLLHAITRQDLDALATIPGFGKKTAERFLFEIKDKVQSFLECDQEKLSSEVTQVESQISEIVSILSNLGYKRGEAEIAAQKAIEKNPGESKIQVLVKSALKHAAGRK
jgi:holliday junction DNA helicase RuvA